MSKDSSTETPEERRQREIWELLLSGNRRPYNRGVGNDIEPVPYIFHITQRVKEIYLKRV